MKAFEQFKAGLKSGDAIPVFIRMPCGIPQGTDVHACPGCFIPVRNQRHGFSALKK